MGAQPVDPRIFYFYSYVDSREQLGLNHQADYGALFNSLLDGNHLPLNELLP